MNIIFILGFARFTKVRIPRTNMLMKYSKVSPSGIYSKPVHAKIVHNTLVGGRADIIFKASHHLAAAITIGIRYSIVRKQGNKPSSQDELQVIDYQYQQYKLFTGLANTYVIFFSGKFTRALYFENSTKMRKGDVSLMLELHAVTAVFIFFFPSKYSRCIRSLLLKKYIIQYSLL